MGEAFTVQMSRALVNQLTEHGAKQKKNTKRSKQKLPREPQGPQPKVHQRKLNSDASQTQQGASPAGWPIQPPLFLPVPPPSQSADPKLEAIRSVLRESEKVLEKLEKQEGQMLKEVTQRAKELHEKEFNLPYEKPMPCVAEKDACLACYKEHAKDPLKCAGMVRSFQDCVRRARQQVD